jgi:hypothetical protein
MCACETRLNPSHPPFPYAHSHMHTRIRTFVKHGRSPNGTSIRVRNQ